MPVHRALLSAVLFLLTVAHSGPARAAAVSNLRYDCQPDYLRFVVEFDAPFRYENHNTLAQQNSFYVDVLSVTGGAVNRVIPFAEGLVERIECAYQASSRVQRFIFHLRDRRPYGVEALSKPNRLVVDVLRHGLVTPAPDGARVAAHPPAPSAMLAAARPAAATERKWTVIVDPGHGGKSIGAESGKIVGGVIVKEKEVVLSVGLELAQLIERSPNMTCRLTRTKDVYVSLPDRVQIATQGRGDVFVSLHCNSVDKRYLASQRKVCGVEFYYLDETGGARQSNRVLAQLENDEGVPGVAKPNSNPLLGDILKGLAKDRQAECIADSRKLCETMEKTFRTSPFSSFRAYNRGVRRENFHVLRQTEMPAMLLEIGYLSNDAEAAQLNQASYRSHVAKLVFNSLNEFFSQRDPAFKPVQVALR